MFIFSLVHWLHRNTLGVSIVLCAALTGHQTPKRIHISSPLCKKLSHLSKTDICSLDLLARTVYGEARNQKAISHKAIAHVILNRAQNDSQKIPNVIYKKKHFTCWSQNDPNRKEIERASCKNRVFSQIWSTCLEAFAAQDITHGADHYHALYVLPKWSQDSRMKTVARIGAHLFYKGTKPTLLQQ